MIEWANDYFTSGLAFVTYEPFRHEDKYGSMMIKNFRHRGCDLLTMKEFSSLESQKARYEKRGGCQEQMTALGQRHLLQSLHSRSVPT